MPSLDNSESSGETLDFYKSHIRELEAELADFQASSRELEQELEKELEASEKQHRDLRNKNEALRYEVDEWKVAISPPPVVTAPIRGVQVRRRRRLTRMFLDAE